MIIPVSDSLFNDKGFYTEEAALVDIYVIKLPSQNASEKHVKNPVPLPYFPEGFFFFFRQFEK